RARSTRPARSARLLARRPQPRSPPACPPPARVGDSKRHAARLPRARAPARLAARFRQPRRMHLTEAILAPLRERYGEPARLEWEGEIDEREHALATYNPKRMHDVTLFILNGERLALIRKPHFEQGIWRPPGGGIKES